jgi:hypothetical protein
MSEAERGSSMRWNEDRELGGVLGNSVSYGKHSFAVKKYRREITRLKVVLR